MLAVEGEHHRLALRRQGGAGRHDGVQPQPIGVERQFGRGAEIVGRDEAGGNAVAFGRTMGWPIVARRYVDSFERVWAGARPVS